MSAQAALARKIISARVPLTPSHVAAVLRMAGPGEVRRLEEQATSSRADLLAPLVTAYSRSARLDDAMRVLGASCNTPPVDAFSPLLVGCVANGDERALQASVRLMSQRRLQPDGDVYGSLILARLDRGEVSRAARLCLAALQRMAPPPTAAVEPLLIALIGAGRSGDALELIAEMRRLHGMHLAADSPAVTTLIASAAGSSAAFEATSVLEEMRRHGRGGGRLEASREPPDATRAMALEACRVQRPSCPPPDGLPFPWTARRHPLPIASGVASPFQQTAAAHLRADRCGPRFQQAAATHLRTDRCGGASRADRRRRRHRAAGRAAGGVRRGGQPAGSVGAAADGGGAPAPSLGRE